MEAVLGIFSWPIFKKSEEFVSYHHLNPSWLAFYVVLSQFFLTVLSAF